MKNPLQGLRVALLLAAAFTILAAAAPAPKAPAAADQVSGTFSSKGKTYKLTHAVAFVDQKDDRKPTLILLTDDEVPVAGWTSEFDLMRYRMDHKFAGVVFWLDAERQDFRSEYDDKDSLPTSTSGVFDLKLDEGKGKTFSGSAHSTKAAEKLENPVTLDVRFSVTLK